MKLPYDLQQLYIKMLSSNFTRREVIQNPLNNIIEVSYLAPDGKRYETRWITTHERVMMTYNNRIGDP